MAQRKRGPHCFARGQQHKFHSIIATEEEEYNKQMREEEIGVSQKDPDGQTAGESHSSFQDYREKTKAAGGI